MLFPASPAVLSLGRDGRLDESKLVRLGGRPALVSSLRRATKTFSAWSDRSPWTLPSPTMGIGLASHVRAHAWRLMTIHAQTRRRMLTEGNTGTRCSSSRFGSPFSLRAAHYPAAAMSDSTRWQEACGPAARPIIRTTAARSDQSASRPYWIVAGLDLMVPADQPAEARHEDIVLPPSARALNRQPGPTPEADPGQERPSSSVRSGSGHDSYCLGHRAPLPRRVTLRRVGNPSARPDLGAA